MNGVFVGYENDPYNNAYFCASQCYDKNDPDFKGDI